jgi:hypothetical protein
VYEPEMRQAIDAVVDVAARLSSAAGGEPDQFEPLQARTGTA